MPTRQKCPARCGRRTGRTRHSGPAARPPNFQRKNNEKGGVVLCTPSHDDADESRGARRRGGDRRTTGDARPSGAMALRCRKQEVR